MFIPQLNCKMYFGTSFYTRNNLIIFWICLFSTETFAHIKHGSSIKIVNVGDSGYMTSTEHSFRPVYGVNVGNVFSEIEFDGTPNQIWDAIRFPNTPMHQFWLYPKGTTLNEITALNLNDSSIPAKNIVELIYVKNVNGTGHFLIKSTELHKCVQSQGPNLRILYATCDAHNLAQHWKGEIVHDEDKGRSKTKFYCKFSSG